MKAERLILASASPRRRELLSQLATPFDVCVSPYEELSARPRGVSPACWAEALAYFKARAVAEIHPRARVIGADTLVECAGQVLGKPRDRADAERMLCLQASRETLVITGVCLLPRQATARRQRVLKHVVTRVWMRDDAQQRGIYLDSGDWEGKAGAYGIQDVGDRLIERIDGSFTNVVGLPLELLAQILPRY